MVSWGRIFAYSEIFTKGGGDREGGESSDGGDGEIAIYRVGGLLPVIARDAGAWRSVPPPCAGRRCCAANKESAERRLLVEPLGEEMGLAADAGRDSIVD